MNRETSLCESDMRETDSTSSSDGSLVVLLIEDETREADAVRNMLAGAPDAGIDLVRADRLSAGLDRLAQGDIDVVLLDLGLPDSSGLDTLKTALPKAGDLPVVVMTATEAKDLAALTVRHGAQDYLQKGVFDGPGLVRTIRYAAERSTAASRTTSEHVSAILRDSPDGVIVAGEYGTVLYANPMAETLFQRENGGITGREFGHPLIAGDVTEIALIGERGTTTVAEMRATETEWKGRTAFLVFLRDMTDRKALQAQLIQSEKLASIGQLAAGVAHEINNPTGFVMSNLGTLKGYVTAFRKTLAAYDALAAAAADGNGHDMHGALARVKEIQQEEDLAYIMDDVDGLLGDSLDGMERIRDIVQGLKSFARIDENERMKEADINEGIEATLKIVWNELKYKCTVNKELGPLPRILCNLGQLNQVFMNLLVNAAHAIPDQGEITIKTEATDDQVIVRISDTGSGIAPESIPRLFDPFFTTKPAGKGTGMGLSISHGIVEEHNGTITVDSQLGKGTTFTIRLPIENADSD